VELSRYWLLFRFIAWGSTAGNVGLLEHTSNVPQSALKSRATVSAMADLASGRYPGIAANALSRRRRMPNDREEFRSVASLAMMRSTRTRMPGLAVAVASSYGEVQRNGGF